jgi:predicted permease
MEAVDNPLPEGVLAPVVDQRRASPGYFAAMEIDLLEGRELTWEDAANGTRSAVVSEALARTLWPNEGSVLRQRIRYQGEESEVWEVVGVARDVRFETLVDEPAPLIYLPLIADDHDGIDPARTMAAVLHVGADPLSFVPAAREALREVDPRLPMIDPTTVERIAQDAMSATSFTTLLLGIAAVIALVLGTVGIYGVISYVVSRRTQEIGVRMALGAPAAVVLRDVVAQGMALTGVGLAVGLAGAWGVSRLLSSLLYGVSTTDPLTYAGTALGLALVALLASWIPARRAASVDAVEALRQE